MVNRNPLYINGRRKLSNFSVTFGVPGSLQELDDERHLKRFLKSYIAYYHRWRVHRAPEMNYPEPREAHGTERGRVIKIVAPENPKSFRLSVPKTPSHCQPYASFQRQTAKDYES